MEKLDGSSFILLKALTLKSRAWILISCLFTWNSKKVAIISKTLYFNDVILGINEESSLHTLISPFVLPASYGGPQVASHVLSLCPRGVLEASLSLHHDQTAIDPRDPELWSLVWSSVSLCSETQWRS